MQAWAGLWRWRPAPDDHLYLLDYRALLMVQAHPNPPRGSGGRGGSLCWSSRPVSTDRNLLWSGHASGCRQAAWHVWIGTHLDVFPSAVPQLLVFEKGDRHTVAVNNGKVNFWEQKDEGAHPGRVYLFQPSSGPYWNKHHCGPLFVWSGKQPPFTPPSSHPRPMSQARVGVHFLTHQVTVVGDEVHSVEWQE